MSKDEEIKNIQPKEPLLTQEDYQQIKITIKKAYEEIESEKEQSSTLRWERKKTKIYDIIKIATIVILTIFFGMTLGIIFFTPKKNQNNN